MGQSQFNLFNKTTWRSGLITLLPLALVGCISYQSTKGPADGVRIVPGEPLEAAEVTPLDEIFAPEQRFSEVFVFPNERHVLVVLREQALAGNPDAQSELADKYLYGADVEQDLSQALYWYELSAANDSVYSQYMASLMQQKGYGTAPNPQAASAWYELAIQTPDNGEALGQVAENLFRSNSPLNNAEESRYWLERAANAGDVRSQVILADMLLQGWGGPVDSVAAIRWYGKAAEDDVPYAQYSVGYLLMTDELIGINPTEARMWFLRAANNGLDAARYNLGDLYYHGNGVEVDHITAYAWWMASDAADNNPVVQQRLKAMAESFTLQELQVAEQLALSYRLGEGK